MFEENKDDNFTEGQPSFFVWFNIVETMVKNLNYKESEVYKLTYLHVLNWLVYWSKNKNKD